MTRMNWSLPGAAIEQGPSIAVPRPRRRRPRCRRRPRRGRRDVARARRPLLALRVRRASARAALRGALRVLERAPLRPVARAPREPGRRRSLGGRRPADGAAGLGRGAGRAGLTDGRRGWRGRARDTARRQGQACVDLHRGRLEPPERGRRQLPHLAHRDDTGRATAGHPTHGGCHPADGPATAERGGCHALAQHAGPPQTRTGGRRPCGTAAPRLRFQAHAGTRTRCRTTRGRDPSDTDARAGPAAYHPRQTHTHVYGK